MNADRDTERIVRSWLEVGVTALPDHILDTVLDQLPATPQRRPVWPTRRFAQMTTPIKLAIGAAAVLVVAIVGYNLLPGSSSLVGGPGPSPTGPALPTSTPTPVALQAPDLGSALDAGRYRVAEPFLRPVSLTIPAGWKLDELGMGMATMTAPSGAQLVFALVDAVPLDPCHADRGDRSPAPRSAAGLEAALTTMAGFDASPVLTTSIGGYPARHFTISNSIDTATSECTGDAMLPLFQEMGGKRPATNGGTSQELWVVDVREGLLIVADPPTTAISAAERAQVESMLSSIAFD